MNSVHVLYGVVLAGSLTFGLEASLIAFGGRISVIFQRDRGKLLALTTALGLGITITSIVLVTTFSLRAIYLPVFLISFTLASGKLIGVWRDEFFKPKEVTPPAGASSEREIRVMLEKRGFKDLIEENEE